jgi:hypothetical protein
VARNLPERTVEAWATAYIVRWFPGAHLWAPTQRDPYGWDLSGALPGGMHWVFEYKGVEAYRGPYVPVAPAQLDDYIAVNRRLGGTFAWYVLPVWDYGVAPGQVLPNEVELRTSARTIRDPDGEPARNDRNPMDQIRESRTASTGGLSRAQLTPWNPRARSLLKRLAKCWACSYF